MAGPYKVRITVKEITKNECPLKNKPGDSWLIEDGRTPGGMCSDAYEASLARTPGYSRYTRSGGYASNPFAELPNSWFPQGGVEWQRGIMFSSG